MAMMGAIAEVTVGETLPDMIHTGIKEREVMVVVAVTDVTGVLLINHQATEDTPKGGILSNF